MPITVIAKLKVQPGKDAEFEAAAKQMIATVKESEPGTLSYVLHKNTKDATEFIYYEVYQDQAALDSHGKKDRLSARRPSGNRDPPGSRAQVEQPNPYPLWEGTGMILLELKVVV
jgi:quinol monooxygenase YgiN